MKFIQAAENNKTEILQFFAKTAKLGDEFWNWLWNGSTYCLFCHPIGA